MAAPLVKEREQEVEGDVVDTKSGLAIAWITVEPAPAAAAPAVVLGDAPELAHQPEA